MKFQAVFFYGMKFALRKAKGGGKMKDSRIFKRSKAVSLALVLLVASLALLPLYSDAGVCEAAFGRCAVDAVIVGLFGGFASGVIYAAGCALGYQWCLMYYL